MPNPEYLILLDCDKIKDYVFTTGRLKEIRGASSLVKMLTEDPSRLSPSLLQALQKAQLFEKTIPQMIGSANNILYSAGGSAKIVIENVNGLNKARRLIKEAERLFRKETITSSLTGEEVELASDPKKFYACVEEGERKLRRKKEGRHEAREVAGGLFIRFCESCGLGPVARFLDDKWLCSSCAKKRTVADEAKKILRNIFCDDPFWREFLKQVNNTTVWESANFPDELKDIGEVSNPPNYLGFIYCDGNRMSEHLKKLKSKDEYKDFSDKIASVTLESAAYALAKHFPIPRNKGRIPFEIVLLGGDDLILITAADKTIKVALDFCWKFQKMTAVMGLPGGIKEISMSAGVILAHANHPILSLQKRSIELLKSAKRLSMEKSAEDGEVSTIDFLVTTSSTLNPLGLIRKKEYRDDPTSSSQPRLICRPYTCEDAKKLTTWIGRFKSNDLPKNKLNSLYNALFQRKAQATLDALYLRASLSKEHRDLFNKFADDFGLLMEFPWRKDTNNRLETLICDLVELYDFIE